MKKLVMDVDVSGIKRCYADGQIELKCQECGNMLVHDFNSQYLSYPRMGSDDSVWFYCNECTSEYNLPIKIVSAKLEIEYGL